MPQAGDTIEVRFAHAGQDALVSASNLRQAAVAFLEHCFAAPLAPRELRARLAGESGEERFLALLEATGFAGDELGFFREVASRLERMGVGRQAPVWVGGVEIPYHLLLALLEVIVPGSGSKTVKKVSQLEQLANVAVPEEERAALQRVLDLYPVRLSMHTIRQMRLSRDVAIQYMPFVEELDPAGAVHTWVGQFHRGIVEQMYRNRVILVMNMTCPVYCRFCFRKHKECRSQRTPTKDHVRQAVAYLHTAEDVREIVLTGGDPFMNRATLQFAVQELAKVPHVQTLRVASRAVSYAPELFLGNDGYWLSYLLKTAMDLAHRGKRLELATHFIHPDEISYDALDVITRLTRNGVPVYVQTPFVADCNDTGTELAELFATLRAAGAEMHYIFMPTSPIRGNSAYWTTIAQGLAAARRLRATVSDRAIPHLTTATSIGKVDWNSSGWAVERREDDPGRIWIRTPYTRDYYEPFAPLMQLSGRVRPNAEGTLDAEFMADIGDDSLLLGPRALASSPEAHEHLLRTTSETVATSLEQLQASLLADQRRLDVHIGPRPCAAVARDHLARAEIDCGASDDEIDAAIAYVTGHSAITDVILSRQTDLLSGMSRTLAVAERVRAIPHVTAIRLRSLRLAHVPDALPRAAISRIAPFNRLQPVGPTRIEIETQFLHSSEFRPGHARVVRELRSYGITVYNNTPLLGFVNDNDDEMLRISSGCRDAGIEFCSVYVAGLPIQDRWNADHPIVPSSVLDIATGVRRHGSGREIPRYVVRTRIGEVDFSIAPPIFEPHGDEVGVRILDLGIDHFRSIDPEFDWPDGVVTDTDGFPLAPVSGISLENQEFATAAPGRS